MINQRLLPPTFPRYTKIKNNVDSFHYFELLLHRLKQALKITTYTSFHEALVSSLKRLSSSLAYRITNSTLFRWQHYFIELSRSNPCIVSRSVMQILYMQGNSKVLGTTYIGDVLRETARNFICPPVLSGRSQLINKEEVSKKRDITIVKCTCDSVKHFHRPKKM